MIASSAQGGGIAGRTATRSILFELTRLTAVIALPLLGVIAYLLVDTARRDLDHATDDARRFADQTAARSERFLNDFRGTLEAVALRPLVRTMDPGHCDPALPTLRELYPRAGNILVVDAAGWIVCGAKPPPSGERVRIVDLELHRSVIQGGQFGLSKPLIGRISKTWVVTAVQPVRGERGEVVGAVGMAIDLDLLRPFGKLDSERPDVVAGIIAGSGVVIAHSTEPERWIGQDVSGAPAAAAMLDRKEGTLSAPGIDGTDRLWVFRPVAGTDWIAYASVAEDAATAPARRRALGALILAMVIVGATIAAATYTARRIAQPVRAIAEVARARASGADDVRATPEGPKEVSDVAAAFNAMIDARLRVEQERELAQTKLRLQLARLHLLHRITRAIGERQDLRSIFQVVIRSLEDDLPIDFGCICLSDGTQQAIVLTSIGIRSGALLKNLATAEQARIPVDRNGLSRCMQGQLVYEPDIAQTTLPFLEQLAAAELRALVLAPLAAENKVFGVLFAARKESHSFSSAECEFLRQLSDHVALATHQAQLRTSLQQAYDDLRQSQQTVMQQERLRALGQMASGVAHDINNAVAPIALYTESLLEHERGLTDRARGYLSIIQRAIADVGETVSRMREFYRPQDQAASTRVDLNSIASQVIELTRVRWRDLPQERGAVILMRTELQQTLPPILGQESEIRDALTNLIFNAVDAMPEGGPLTVRTRVVANPARGAKAQTVQLEVSDGGTGMDEETRRRCLEPFYTTKGQRGTGLGLAMVYGMAQRHGAELEIDSAPGQGTTVRISFAAAEAEADMALRATTPERPLRSLSILIVDDDPLVLESLRIALENDGHRVTAADGGQVGIDSFTAAHERGERPDVVITDLGMPYVDGRRVAAAINAISPSTPIVLLTGWGQRLVDDGEVPAHVARVLNKPPKLRDLRAALAELTTTASAT